MELFAPLHPDMIHELGDEYHLGLSQSETDRIQKNYQSPIQRKEAYLDLYVHQHPYPTWSRIARVLCYGTINLPQQADLVENTYVKGIQVTSYRDCCLCINKPHCMYMYYNRKLYILLTHLSMPCVLAVIQLVP